MTKKATSPHCVQRPSLDVRKCEELESIWCKIVIFPAKGQSSHIMNNYLILQQPQKCVPAIAVSPHIYMTQEFSRTKFVSFWMILGIFHCLWWQCGPHEWPFYKQWKVWWFWVVTNSFFVLWVYSCGDFPLRARRHRHLFMLPNPKYSTLKGFFS